MRLLAIDPGCEIGSLGIDGRRPDVTLSVARCAGSPSSGGEWSTPFPRPRATHVRKNLRRRRLVAARLCAGRAKSVENRTSGTGDRW